jgi:hypothetical protein
MTQVITPEYIQSDNQASSPGTPPKGYVRLYVKTDDIIYIKNDAGTEASIMGDVIDLNGFSDVVLTSPATDTFLRYDSGTSKWIDEDMPTPTIDVLDDFSEVTISSLSAGDSLIFQGGVFKNDKYQPGLMVLDTGGFGVPDSGGGDFDYLFFLDGTNSGETTMINDGYLSLWQTASAEEDLGVYLLTAYLRISGDGVSNDITINLYEIGGGATTIDSVTQIHFLTADPSANVYTVIYCPIIPVSGKQYTLGATKSVDTDNPTINFRISWEKLGHAIS